MDGEAAGEAGAGGMSCGGGITGAGLAMTLALLCVVVAVAVFVLVVLKGVDIEEVNVVLFVIVVLVVVVVAPGRVLCFRLNILLVSLRGKIELELVVTEGGDLPFG